MDQLSSSSWYFTCFLNERGELGCKQTRKVQALIITAKSNFTLTKNPYKLSKLGAVGYSPNGMFRRVEASQERRGTRNGQGLSNDRK